MSTKPHWGVCATIKASTTDILRFAAHHLDAGAHRIWIYLDVPDPIAHAALKQHPKCRVIECNDLYWNRIFGRRPKKHQTRQSLNATRTFSRAGDVTWLLHADVDEFVVAQQPVSEALATMSEDTLTARIRPMEALAEQDPLQTPKAFKKFIPAGKQRARIVHTLYPDYADCLRGGFLSHVAGKVFVRTGQPDLTLRIHNAFCGEMMNPQQSEVPCMALAHLHAPNWSTWRAHFDYRLEKGSYRADLAAAKPAKPNRVNLHAFLSTLLATKGENGLRAFFDTVCLDTPDLRARLEQQGLLEMHDLDLDAKLHRHFAR